MVQNRKVRGLVIVLAVLLIGYLGGLRIAHPQEGLGTSLGSAKTSLVIYRAGDSLDFENKIIFKSNSGNTALGMVAGTNGTSAYVNVDTRFEQVGQEQVKGKLLSVLPFLGVIVGLVGL
jgi:hypothetical protein